MPENKQFSFDSLLNFILSNRQFHYLLAILFFGFILRFVAANNLAPLADEMIHGTNAINIIHSGVINAQNQAPAWLYLTDIFYKLFGVFAFSARFASILFGSLTILVVYLLGAQLFNRRIGMISAFLMSISYFYIRYTLMEMDQAMTFFILLAFYFYHKDFVLKSKIPIITSVLLGVALLIKPITLPFIAGFALCTCIIIYQKTNRNEILRVNRNRIILSLLILLAFAMPILAYNYILYQQKGISDVIFSRFLGINQQIYSSLQGYNKTFVLSEILTVGFPTLIKALLELDPLIFLLSLFGFLVVFMENQFKSGKLFVIFQIPALLFLLGTSVLETHLSTFVPIICLAAGITIHKFSEKDYFGINKKHILLILLSLILIVNLYLMAPTLTSKSAFSQMRVYAAENFVAQDLVIADSRIYRGRIAWMFNDKTYLESSYFPKLLELNQNLSDERVTVNIYYIECAPDDCGWGTIKDQPDFNASMEQLGSALKSQLTLEKTLYGGGGYNEITGQPNLIVYRGEIQISPQLYAPIYATHEWFYYPVRWMANDWYDKYSSEGFFQDFIQAIGVFMLWASIVLALLSPLLLFSELYKNLSSQQSDKNQSNHEPSPTH